jgi:hypothetical protein
VKVIISGQRALTAEDFAELALGTPLDLWLGAAGESPDERAAREAAARDILADDPGLYRRVLAVLADAPAPLLPAPALTVRLLEAVAA